MKRPRLILVGAGGHARSVAAALSAEVVGYVDLHPCEDMPWPYLGDDSEFISAPVDGDVIVTLVSDRSCDLSVRRKLLAQYDSLIHNHWIASDAIVDSTATIGDGTVVMRKAVINCLSVLGRHCIVNTGAIVEHHCQIGRNVFIGPGAVICGGVHIGDDVYIGANVSLRPGISVASGSVIGLGAAVTTDIVAPGIYGGVPAKLLKK
ncbi:MAG: hypothetical protein K2M19_06345 [Muribaculaceae bacterium]|nr:hypothetical protein [Muribaculaceae bacterium]